MFKSIKSWFNSTSVISECKHIMQVKYDTYIISEPILTIGEIFRTNHRRFKITQLPLSDGAHTQVYYIKDGYEMFNIPIEVVDNSIGTVFTLLIQSNRNYTDVEVVRFSYGKYDILGGSQEAIYLSGLCREYIRRILKVMEYKGTVRSRDADTKRYLATQRDKKILMSLYCKEGK